MRDVYVVEIEEITAGILLRDESEAEFRFFAASEPFDLIEAARFGDPREAQRAAERLYAQRFGDPKARLQPPAVARRVSGRLSSRTADRANPRS
ncbi:MAG: hypothetical protein JNK11_07035 [Alphaproteobacteria bacterium]|nr:hypothetical protein [Alphaproteobacteria bacterium]